MNNVDYLIVSSTLDYSTDLVCYELGQRSKKFLRVNRDLLSKYNLVYSLQDDALSIEMGDQEYVICPKKLKAVYFRAPVFLRGTGKPYSPQEGMAENFV